MIVDIPVSAFVPVAVTSGIVIDGTNVIFGHGREVWRVIWVDEVRVERYDGIEMFKLVVECDWSGEIESGRWMVELNIWWPLIEMDEMVLSWWGG